MDIDIEKYDIIFEGEQIMTLADFGLIDTPAVVYCGDSEIEAMKKLKEFKKERKIVRAYVKKVQILDMEIIKEYEILEVLKSVKN